MRAGAMPPQWLIFFFCVMVGSIMTRRVFASKFANVTAPAVTACALVHPGTLVFPGLTR